MNQKYVVFEWTVDFDTTVQVFVKHYANNRPVFGFIRCLFVY